MTTRTPLPIVPPSPAWIVRQPPRCDFVEVVFVGVTNREELDRDVERIAVYPWSFDDKVDHGVEILADVHADLVGVRLRGLAGPGNDDTRYVRGVLCTLFDHSLVAHAVRAIVAAKLI